jgi:hypothetical protein
MAMRSLAEIRPSGCDERHNPAASTGSGLIATDPTASKADAVGRRTRDRCAASVKNGTSDPERARAAPVWLCRADVRSDV